MMMQWCQPVSAPLVAALPFIHPGLAAAAVAAALIPLLVHLINRRRHRRVHWAAMGFLLAAHSRSQRRVRLEHWILLLLRMSVLVLLGLAVARPLLPGRALLGLSDAHRHHVLLVDNSLSACSEPGGAEDRGRMLPAVRAASEMLSSIPPGDAVSVIALADPAAPVIGHAAFDRLSVRARLESVPPTQRSTDLTGGFTAAREVLEDSSAAPGNRAVYVFSDHAATAWQTHDEVASLAGSIAEQAKVILVATTAEQRSNVAVTRLSCADRLPGTNLPIRLRAEVANFGTAFARGLSLQIRRDERVVRRLEVDPIEPGGRAQLDFAIVVDSPGTHVIEARLDAGPDDSQRLDNARRMSLEVFQAVPVLLVDGRAGAGRFSGEAGYLATALAPGVRPSEASLLAPKIITEAELSTEPLDAYHVVVLCNVALTGGRRESANRSWQRIEEYVQAGGGLLVFCGDAVSADHYNRLGYSGGDGLLPGRLSGPVGDAADRESFVRFRGEAFTHPAVADFAEAERSGLFGKGRIHRYFSVEPHPEAATVLLRYAEGEPAILERSYGQGTVCLATTTANMAWNNLAARGDYVSLAWGLVSHLAGGADTARNLLVGQTIREPLVSLRPPDRSPGPDTPAGGGVIEPDGGVHDARVDTAAGGYLLEYGPVERVGVYVLTAGTRRLEFAVNPDPGESDLRVLGQDALQTLIGKPVTYLSDPADLRRGWIGHGPGEITRASLFLVLMLLVCEVWLAMRFATAR